MLRLLLILIQLVADAVRWCGLMPRSQRSIEAESLFLRRQLALYVERGVKPRRIDSVTRVAPAFLSRFFPWRDALVVVRPETMIRWHRAGWKLLWRLKSRPGRPSIPIAVQALIRRMANENPSWGEERIANELVPEAGNSGLSANGEQVSADPTNTSTARRYALVNLSAPARPGDHCL
jgi:putative transposase